MSSRPDNLVHRVPGDVPTFVPQVQSGMLRWLAVTSRKRLPELPNVPTVDELGFPDLEASAWFHARWVSAVR